MLELELIGEKTKTFCLRSGEENSQQYFNLKQIFYEDIISVVGRDHQVKLFLEINHSVFIYPVTEVPLWTES